jgi:hypothetical protein
MFSLDVCHALQFYRKVLAEPISHNNYLIILGHPCIFWNLDIFLETFGIYILEYIGDFWRSIIGVSSVDL